MRRALSEFFRRQSAVEILAAFAIASAGLQFLYQAAQGFIVTPIVSEVGGEDDLRTPGSFVIAGHEFDWLLPLVWFLVLLGATIGVGVLLRGARTQPGDELHACPHCLAEIPVEAGVCSYCTRDVS